MARAQASVELMLLTGVLLVILVVFSMFAYQKKVEIESEVTLASGQALADALALRANTAIAVGDGYSEDFVVPYALANGVDYLVEWGEGAAIVSWVYGSPFEARAHLLYDASLCGTLNKGAVNNIANVQGELRVNGVAC